MTSTPTMPAADEFDSVATVGQFADAQAAYKARHREAEYLRINTPPLPANCSFETACTYVARLDEAIARKRERWNEARAEIALMEGVSVHLWPLLDEVALAGYDFRPFLYQDAATASVNTILRETNLGQVASADQLSEVQSTMVASFIVQRRFNWSGFTRGKPDAEVAA